MRRASRHALRLVASRCAIDVGVMRIGGLLVLLLAMAVVALPASASAESICTDTWVGASTGTWQTASNWSTSATPTSTDVACIPSGTTVNVTAGTNQAAVLQNAGGLNELLLLDMVSRT